MQFDALIIASDAMHVKQNCTGCIAPDATSAETLHAVKKEVADVYKEIGAVVKRLREDRGMSLEDLAGVMQYPKGGDPSGLQRLESGGKRVYLDLYEQIASAFGLPLSAIIREAEGDGDPDARILSGKEKQTISSYLSLSDSAKGALEYIIAATAEGDKKTGNDSTP